MDPAKNPYVPNAGATPFELAGRKALISDFQAAVARARIGRSPRSMIPYGLRGVGKTVLLNRFCEEASTRGYLVAYIEADDHGGFLGKLATEVRRLLFALDASARVNEVVKKAIRVLKSFVVKVNLLDLSAEIGVDPERGQGDTGNLATDMTSLLLALGEAARSQDTAVLIAVDEVQYISEADFEALIVALHRVVQQALPLLSVATGLPSVLALAGDAKTYAERLFDFREIGALSRADSQIAIVEPAVAEGVKFRDAAVERLYTITSGYPFFIQEWCYSAWNAADESPISAEVIDRMEGAVVARLDESFFRVRFDRTTPSERRYLRAMAELGSGPYQSADVSRVLGQKPSQATPARDSLIKKGMIYSPEHGLLEYTVPLFDGFMRRAMSL